MLGFEGEYPFTHSGTLCAVVQHRVSGSILCPLGYPKKAIGLEPLIGSWLALKPTLSLRSFGTERRRAPLTSGNRRVGTSSWGGYRRGNVRRAKATKPIPPLRIR